jgi:hypothetical protein
MGERIVYLAGAVELADTWRERAARELEEAGFVALDPLRGEECKVVGKHLVPNIPAELIVARDLNDLRRVERAAGVCLMHLRTTEDGRQPTATLCEMMWCHDHGVPIIGVIGPKCSPYLREHPWVKVMITHRETSLTAALDTIIRQFK